MTTSSVPERILSFNSDRNPALLTGKYSAMRESAFRFFRGTSHLFNNDIPATSFIWESPQTWNVGDLHIENFGSFKADNRVPYFDLNDFDECILAPNLADLARLTCSVYVAADSLNLNAAEVDHLAKKLIISYASTLSLGYIRPLEQETATGIIRHFLRSVQFRKRRPFLKRFVTYRKHHIRFKKSNLHVRPIDEDTKTQIASLLTNWAEGQPDPDFFNVLDVAHRVVGTGSLGIDRFIVLVGHSLKPGKQFLLDVKRALPSTLQMRLASRQPYWSNEAERVVEVQKRMQAASPALLYPLTLPNGSYVLRELQPIEDKITLAGLIGKHKKVESLIATMGQLCAWSHLRSSGRQGSAIADELIAFGLDLDAWQQLLIDYAYAYARQVKADYTTYCQAYDDEFFKVG
ncbi:DUF2252 domain-containing protein [Spirosoma validum]|uniref:DUF2252 family protein n=1 Tax=Spirosoma validum TaxID=2771355 RepID=A0A927AZN9_9BACT|nr:DUF2252 family protein [Spirosoma validum]MBD2752841.1 DUF2252 family protein [Spirosoma validum]